MTALGIGLAAVGGFLLWAAMVGEDPRQVVADVLGGERAGTNRDHFVPRARA